MEYARSRRGTSTSSVARGCCIVPRFVRLRYVRRAGPVLIRVCTRHHLADSIIEVIVAAIRTILICYLTRYDTCPRIFATPVISHATVAKSGLSGGKEDYNFTPSSLWDGWNWNQRASGQPFFAQVNIRNLDHEGGYGNVDPKLVDVPPYHPDDLLTRAAWAHYHRRTQHYDRRVGEVLQRLKNDGLEENTVVFLMGDNGRQVQRGMQFLYDGGIHIPLIVRWPGVLPEGAKSDDLVSLVDLAPTSLAIAGIEPPSYMQGDIFLGPGVRKRKYVYAARDRMDETMDRIRCVRSDRYKYIRNYTVWGESERRPYTRWGPYHKVARQSNLYKMHSYPVLSLLHVMHGRGKLNAAQELFMVDKKPHEEFYDVIADPHEINNLSFSPEHDNVKRAMSGSLDDWMESTGESGQTPEDRTIADQWYRDKLRPYYIRLTSGRLGMNVDSTAAEYLNYWRRQFK